jgi:hypothetical protein
MPEPAKEPQSAMACARCAPILDRPREDRGGCSKEDVYHDLSAFEILECYEDKHDSGTMWWYGRAHCRSCGQHVRFEYMCGGQNYAEARRED